MKRILSITIIFAVAVLSACNMPANEAIPQQNTATQVDGTSPSSADPIPDTSSVQESSPSNLLAFYEFTTDFSDKTGLNGPAVTSFGSPSPDGLFCNAVCDLTTPPINGFNFNSFTISVEFFVPNYPGVHDAVFVGGQTYRWASFILLPEGQVALGYNSNQEIPCAVGYSTNTWHEAVINYNGTNLRLFLDGIEGCNIAATLETDNQNLILLRDNGFGNSFSGTVKNLKVYNTVETPKAYIATSNSTNLVDTTISPADEILGSCPSEAELASIDADIQLIFEADPTSGSTACTSAQGSRDLTNFQRIVYTSLLVMRKLEFNQPLPWTNKQIYTWLIDTIDGIRFRDDIEYSSCCDPAGFINVQVNNLGVNTTAKWVDPQMGVGAQDLVVLFIHEARHNEIGGHTCGANDNSRAEMGAWAVQYYTFIYFADNLKDKTFLTIPTPPSLTGYYFDVARGNAEDTLKIRFCNDK